MNLYIEMFFFYGTVYFKEYLFCNMLLLNSKAEDLQQNILLHNSYWLS